VIKIVTFIVDLNHDLNQLKSIFKSIDQPCGNALWILKLESSRAANVEDLVILACTIFD